MIDKQFIVDDINDFLKPNNQQWKAYFDKAECKTILDAIEKSNKYEKIVNVWKDMLTELEKMRDIIWQDTDNNARIVRANAWDKIETLNDAIDIIKQKLAEIEEGEEYE